MHCQSHPRWCAPLGWVPCTLSVSPPSPSADQIPVPNITSRYIPFQRLAFARVHVTFSLKLCFDPHHLEVSSRRVSLLKRVYILFSRNMLLGRLKQPLVKVLLASLGFSSLVHSSVLSDIHHNYFDPPPSPEDGPPFSAGASRDLGLLPAQIGGIVGAYAISLLIVAITLLSLSKRRREHLKAGQDEFNNDLFVYGEDDEEDLCGSQFPPAAYPVARDFANRAVPNFSYKSPTQSEFNRPALYIQPPVSPASTSLPGRDPNIDPSLVAADRAMSQQQLEEMYKYVMEHEEAKEQGIVLDSPVISPVSRASSQGRSSMAKKEKNKPSSLNLSRANEEKTQSKTSSFFNALRSPKKKNMKGLNISSPIMTPQSATFPRQDGQELDAMTPRHYAPSAHPPLPLDQRSMHSSATRNSGAVVPLTPPDVSPESIQSIDERIGAQFGSRLGSQYGGSQAPTEVEPPSATSTHSQAPLVGLPSSPKPGATFPSLPSSPKPGARFQRPNAPSAVRTGGALPLRAYEPSLSSPSAVNHTTKQTVFERRGPLSPGGRTPMTAGVPYSPYQPFTPLVPITPSLVTKEDRKRMKRMVPKTPTVDMVKSSDDMW